MNRTDAIKAMAVIRAAYPAYYGNAAREDIDAAVNLWTMMFEQEPAAEVLAAVKAFIASDVKGFPPHIGAVKEELCKLRRPDGGLCETEAWALVKRALRNGLYGYEKEYRALPEEIRRAVGGPRTLQDWAAMDEQTVDSVVASNFMRSYRARAQHVRELEKLPGDVRALFAAAGEALRLDGQRETDKGVEDEGPLPSAEAGGDGAIPAPEHWKEARRRFEEACAAQEKERVCAKGAGV